MITSRKIFSYARAPMRAHIKAATKGETPPEFHQVP